MGFGLAMGLIFPLYASLFVQFKPGALGWFIAGCIAAGLVVGAVSYYLVRLFVLGPLSAIARGYEEVASGDLSYRVGFESADELGQIAEGFNKMAGSFEEALAQHEKSVAELTRLSDSLVRVATRLERAFSEHGMHISQISSASEQSSVSIAQISSNMGSAASFSSEVSGDAAKGTEDLAKTMRSMKMARESLTHSLEKMDGLLQKSTDIDSVVDIINDIAEQIKVIAFNAALEASGAGAAGKRFSVVAAEVRKLAERASSSTRQIGDIVETLKLGVGETIGEMSEHASLVNSLHEDLTQTSDTLRSMGQRMSHISTMVSQLSSSTLATADTHQSINESLSSIDHALHEVGDAVSEIVGESRALAIQSAVLKRGLKRFKKSSPQGS